MVGEALRKEGYDFRKLKDLDIKRVHSFLARELCGISNVPLVYENYSVKFTICDSSEAIQKCLPPEHLPNFFRMEKIALGYYKCPVDIDLDFEGEPLKQEVDYDGET